MIRKLLRFFFPKYTDQSIVLDDGKDSILVPFDNDWQVDWKDNRPFLLVNTSFSLVNSKFAPVDVEVKALYKEGYIPESLNNMVLGETRAMKAYIELVKRIATEIPYLWIVVRPHPFEASEKYREEFEEFPNVEVISKGPIEFWLRRCLAIVHFECSTALEAALCGKTAFSLSGFDDVRPIPDVHAVTTFGTADEIIKRIRWGL